MENHEKWQNNGQSLWLDHVGRKQICDGSLRNLIGERSVTGATLTSYAVLDNICNSKTYDDDIYLSLQKGVHGHDLVLKFILEDVHHTADLLRHVFDRTRGGDGWVALSIPFMKTADTETLMESILDLYAKVKRPNLLLTIPGLTENLKVIEEIVSMGIPINISLIYSWNQYRQVAASYLRGVERRMDAWSKPDVAIFISIPFAHMAMELSQKMKRGAAIQASVAVVRKIYATMRSLHSSQQWERTYNAGARPPRLAWILSDDMFVKYAGLSLHQEVVAPLTVAAMSEKVMKEACTVEETEKAMPLDGDNCGEVISGLEASGFNFDSIAREMQEKGAAWQVRNWINVLDAVARKSADFTQKNNRM